MERLIAKTARSFDELTPVFEVGEVNKLFESTIESNNKMLGALTKISNMCVGELAMNYKLDAQAIGEIIYEATGKTNPELNKAT